MADGAEAEDPDGELPRKSERVPRRRRRARGPNTPVPQLETPKSLPASKGAEWAGLDRISSVVHGMGCIWREQEKDDIGIDGEIELCVQRADDEGRAGTGKIVKVQSKSGRSYVTKDSQDGFEMPSRRADLEYWRKLEMPVVVVVYHPGEDRLYWVHVQEQLETREDAFEPPYRLHFDKTDTFDESAYDALIGMFSDAPEREATDVEETLYANALQILEMPRRIVRSSVLPEKRAKFRHRLAGFVPPHLYREGTVVTLTQPAATNNALKDVVDGPGQEIDLYDWLDEAGANENNFRFLLKRLLHKHLVGPVGLSFDRDLKRYYFPPGEDDDDRTMRWKSRRTGRSPLRTVAKKHSYGAHTFYKHLGLEPEFLRIGESWALILETKHHYTTDGQTRWDSKQARSYAIRNRAREFNAQYLNHILFWADVLSAGKDSFALRLDGADLVRISGRPLTTNVGFGVRVTSDPTRAGRVRHGA